jgi:hypothetical protein
MAYEELKERQSVMWGNGPYRRPARGSAPRLGRFYETNYAKDGKIAQPSEYLLISGVRR